MYKKIMVPLDGSKLAECALEHVKAIARGCSVPEVNLVRVVSTVPPWAGSEYMDARLLSEFLEAQQAGAREYLKKTAVSLKKGGLAVTTTVLEGNASENLINYAAKSGADLIVMTTHGRSGPARWAFGSVAERVIQHSPVPVLIITPPGCRVGK